MIGHGRPASLALVLARATVLLCACLTGGTLAQILSAAEPVQLRITWGGGEASQWRGRIAIDDGSFSHLKLLEPDPDAAGSIWLDAGQIQVAALSPHKLDRVEVETQLSPTAKIQIDLTATDGTAPPRLEIPLADLPRHPYQVRLDDRGNTLEIRIVPPPALRISANHNPLIYAPGEKCSFELTATMPNLTPGTEVIIQTTLSAGRGKEPLWKSEPQRLAVPVDGHPKASLEVPLPKTEGVYTIHIAATRPSGFERFWSSTTRLGERSFQVVVLDTHPPEAAPNARWDSVLEIDPTNPRWIEASPVGHKSSTFRALIATHLAAVTRR